jgi:hypothetical protein
VMRERRKRQRENKGERNRFGLDIDIWGIPMQLGNRVHAPVGWKYSSCDRDNFFRC